jgi:xanthine dehydrogenase YagT iron-sulfur-binding subunit
MDDSPVDSGVSRRGFLKTTTTVAATTALAGTAQVRAQDKPAEPVSPDARRFLATGQTVTLNINGKPTQVALTPNTTLLEALREKLNLTGSKEVCDRGACGACTVLVDGRSVNSCMMLALDAIGSKVTTVEGLSTESKLDPVQQAFIDHDACQCGFCIPGFVVRSRAMLDENPTPTKEEIRDGLCGNVCRCAAYVRIFEAVESAAKIGVKGGAK